MSFQTLQQRFVSRARHIWRLAVPFWLFRDAATGTPQQRRASYRYNRSQRKVLPFFLLKWIGLAFCLQRAMLPLTQVLASTTTESPQHVAVIVLCAANGIGLAFAVVVIALLLAAYLYLSLVEG